MGNFSLFVTREEGVEEGGGAHGFKGERRKS